MQGIKQKYLIIPSRYLPKKYWSCGFSSTTIRNNTKIHIMKIGIYTIHSAYNYGAMFQAYSTQKTLEKLG